MHFSSYDSRQGGWWWNVPIRLHVCVHVFQESYEKLDTRSGVIFRFFAKLSEELSKLHGGGGGMYSYWNVIVAPALLSHAVVINELFKI